jgi:Flp pilus assembly protein TadG
MSAFQESRKYKNRRGAVLPLLAIFIVALMGCAALSVDLGRMHEERAKLQFAADAAADAAALALHEQMDIDNGLDTNGSARASALELALENGYTADKVTVNIPPLTGPNQAKPGYAEVVINSQINGTFSSIFGVLKLNTKARAVGAGTRMDSKAGLLVMEPSKKKGALKIKGKSSLLEVTADIVVNSVSKKSVAVGKRGSIKADHLITAGGIDQKKRGDIHAKITTGAKPTPDPLASVLSPPAKGPSRKQNDFVTTTDHQNTYDLQPGTYSELKFGSQDVVNMQPGVYYIDGGEISFTGSSSLNAAGVTIYSSTKKTVKFKTTGSIRMSPSTSGPLKGVSMYLNPTKKGKLQFSKSGSYQMSGIIYAPKSEVKFSRADVDFADTEEEEDYTIEDILDEEDIANQFSIDDEDSRDNELLDLGFSMVARRVSVGKKSTVFIRGRDLGIKRPIKGIVE